MEQSQVDNEASGQSGKSQQPRKRKKQYFNRIRHQMEFYFGDANLSKDRFLNKLMAVNPYVPLDVFMTFNKIKELANGIDELQKAIESSDMLELSDDKQSVRRTTEIKKKEDLDEYMVYVEALPPSATHESIKHQFKQFGAIAYVSLPKYRTSGRIKEFAFIEFEDKSSVEKCISAFRQFDGVIGDAQDAENLTSVTSYVKEQEDLENTNAKQKQFDEDDEKKMEAKEEHKNEAECNTNDVQKHESSTKCSEEASSSECSEKEKGSKRPKEGPATSDSDEVPPAKRTKLEESEGEAETEADRNVVNDTEQEKDSQDNTDEKASNTDDNQDHKKKKRRRRKPNPSILATNNGSGFGNQVNNGDDVKPANDDPIQALFPLRAATKVEWKRLRNKYLMLQRQKYAEVKKLLQQNKNGENRKVSTLPLSTVRPVTMKNKKYASPPPSKKICTRNINFYGAMRDEKNTYECSIIDENKPNHDKTNKNEARNDKQLGKDLQFEFEPGLIVKVNFEEPCTDVTDFKAEMKQYAFVRYVDIKEGQTFAFVRVDSPHSAPQLIKYCAPNRCQILTGESETDYWAKIAKDREQKLSKKVKIPKARSRKMRNIIKNIAEINVVKSIDNKTTVSHIRFDDD